MKKITLLSVSALALVLTSCGGDKPTKEAKTPVVEQTTQTHDDAGTKLAGENTLIARKENNSVQVQMALEHPDRLEGDAKDDAARKPDEVLQFAGIAPGMNVVEIEAGTGYYTEIMSRIVGEDGKITMVNPQVFDTFFAPDTFDKRLGADGKRLGNVVHSRTMFDKLDIADASADMVTWVLGPHELWLKDKEGNLTLGAPDVVYSEIFRVLKPGGVFLAIDHKAPEGAPETTGGDTHRIDENAVRARAVAAGFKQIAASDALANDTDDHTLLVFDPKVRRKTDRFIHLYQKPAQ